MNFRNFRTLILPLFIILISACTSNTTQTSQNSAASRVTPTETAEVPSKIPASSPFSKLEVGMAKQQVYDLIGAPTDTKNYSTGKMFIPFYFGNDTMRVEDMYKNQGRIVYTGVGVGGVNLKVYQIIYDPNEDGYNN